LGNWRGREVEKLYDRKGWGWQMGHVGWEDRCATAELLGNEIWHVLILLSLSDPERNIPYLIYSMVRSVIMSGDCGDGIDM